MGVIRNKKAFLAFLLPGLLFYILAVFYPIEESIRLSFMKWGGIGKKQFVGLENYVTMFHDEVFYKAFFNNLICYCSFHAIINWTVFCNIADIYDKACDTG